MKPLRKQRFLSFSLFFDFLSDVLEQIPQRTGETYRRIKTCNDSDYERKRKVLYRGNAEDVNHSNCKERRNRGIDRTPERSLDTFVNFLRKISAAHLLIVFSDFIKDNDCSVDGVTENCEKRCDNRLVYGKL